MQISGAESSYFVEYAVGSDMKSRSRTPLKVIADVYSQTHVGHA